MERRICEADGPYLMPLQTAEDSFTQDLPGSSLPLEDERIKWTHWIDEEALWTRFSNVDGLGALRGFKEEKLKDRFQDIVRADRVERNSTGEVALHGVFHLVWTARV